MLIKRGYIQSGLDIIAKMWLLILLVVADSSVLVVLLRESHVANELRIHLFDG